MLFHQIYTLVLTPLCDGDTGKDSAGATGCTRAADPGERGKAWRNMRIKETRR